MSSRFVMASCSAGDGTNSYGSIRYCSRLCRTLIIFRITHWMFAGFQCIWWCAIRCLYRRCSIRMKMMIWITIFQWMCKLRIGWNRLTLFISLNNFFKKTNWNQLIWNCFHWWSWSWGSLNPIYALTWYLLVTEL